MEIAYSVESTETGVFCITINTRCNAEDNPLVSMHKSLIFYLSNAVKRKNLTIDERNLTSTQWVEYHVGTKRKSYNSLPTSNITAEAVTVDGFVLSQTDNAGVTTTASRSYTANGMIQTRTDGRGNTTTTVTDKAGRTLTVTDAAGVRTLSYNTYGEQESDSLVADRVTHLITETRDDKGRSTGYTYAKNGTVQQTVTTDYGSDGRIATAGFLHGGEEKQFSYEYLSGTHLLEKLTKPNNMTLTQSYEIQRDLLTGMAYHRGSTLVAQREYVYDTLGRPTARNTSRQGSVKNDIFGYNYRSELTTATVNGNNYAYDYDNIGNRETATESDITTNYTANELNQYTAVGDFTPTFDADGNQTLMKTTTGIWAVVYDAENRPVSFTNTESNTIIECTYDHMGRRATKKVTVDGDITLHQRYLYRGYLQIACCDLTRSNHPCLWLITWDPSQPVATRPLAIQLNGTWHTYGWDLTKNICEVYGLHGYIRTNYSFTPYGEVSISGDVTQPIQWSSEYVDTETTLAYYNYRYYSTMMGRWLSRDKISELKEYPYIFVRNSPTTWVDYIGHKKSRIWSVQPHEHDITLDGDYVIYNYMEMEYNNLNEQIHLLANLSIESRNRKVILRARSIANSVGTYLLTDDLDYSDQETALAEVEYTIYCDPSGMLAYRKTGNHTSINGSAMASVSVDFSEGERTGKVNIGFESKIEGAELTWETSIGVKSSSLSVSYPVKTHNALKNNVEFRLMCKCED